MTKKEIQKEYRDTILNASKRIKLVKKYPEILVKTKNFNWEFEQINGELVRSVMYDLDKSSSNQKNFEKENCSIQLRKLLDNNHRLANQKNFDLVMEKFKDRDFNIYYVLKHMTYINNKLMTEENYEKQFSYEHGVFTRCFFVENKPEIFAQQKYYDKEKFGFHENNLRLVMAENNEELSKQKNYDRELEKGGYNKIRSVFAKNNPLLATIENWKKENLENDGSDIRKQMEKHNPKLKKEIVSYLKI